ncbi:hypothetical protein B0H67DRAFT_641914 [Lasiosphaeris hirsuta]|uniref:Uncharacterized protein n=1 Tax=Lasiosphaeris hirsuta TaxID=260670 RepID=A0AA40B0P9_9PEZI|nr:hypothetical protein B0H67DRAFT_641914 [Lasiosphaeris hirsuta]
MPTQPQRARGKVTDTVVQVIRHRGMVTDVTREHRIGFIINADLLLQPAESGKFKHREVPVPGAKEALTYLQANNIPFVIAYNGVREFEDFIARSIQKKLSLPQPISPDAVTISHSQFRDLAPRFENEVVLVIGASGDETRCFAEEYGFKRVVSTLDIALVYKPYANYYRESKERTDWEEEDLEAGIWRLTASQAHNVRVSAILVFWTPENWELDTQVVVDLMSNGGILGDRRSSKADAIKPNPPELHICLVDLYETQDGKRSWFNHMITRWKEESFNSLLKRTDYGSAPSERGLLHYESKLANAQIQAYKREVGWEKGDAEFTVRMIAAVFLIGLENNPRLRSEYDSAWRDIFVQGQALHPKSNPWHIAKDTQEAIEHALWWEYWDAVKDRRKPHWPKPDREAPESLKVEEKEPPRAVNRLWSYISSWYCCGCLWPEDDQHPEPTAEATTSAAADDT